MRSLRREKKMNMLKGEKRRAVLEGKKDEHA